MTKSNGIKSLKQAAKLLNKHAPDGESLAYINPEEAKLLKSHGGSGIQTLAGVPSYIDLGDIWEGIKDVGSSVLGRYTGDKGGSNVIKDLASLWGGYEGMKEAKELSEWEKQQYELQRAKEALNELRFASESDSGKQLLAPQNVPSTIEDVSVFSEATGIPTMKTTAVAEGGRIGYDVGGREMLDMMAQQEFSKNWEDLTKNQKEYIMKLGNRFSGAAQGGRIGYRFGEGVESLPIDQMQAIEGQQAGGEYNRAMELMLKVRENIPLTEEEKEELRGLMQTLLLAKGGRVAAQSGGIMPLLNLGGMEKDYRQDGGFVPIGRKEKADDVPARLSKNEFVFTADAVRAAGGGDIDQGAQRMYNVMKNLEAGGDISEQSQGKA